MRGGVLLGAVLVACSCAPTLTQTALTNGQGRLQVAPEVGAAITGFDERQTVLPSIAVSARYGVTDRFDLGLRLGPGLVELQGKTLLVDPGAARQTKLAVSLAPTLAVAFANVAGVGPFYGRLAVPVLVDVPVGSHRFVFGARLAQVVAPGDARGLNLGWELSGGVSVGFALALGGVVQVLPEVGLDTVLAGRATLLPGASLPQLSFRLGVLFGGSPRAERSTP
ncbi:MAG: hypothetical protein SFW67_18860 [Myxococcaceae bacterium]|nr:hypothetical protein [Myxococcaceae bacterium]